MRKKLTIAAVVVLLVSLVAYGTMAYLTAEYTAHNVITAGTVQIRLLDKTMPEELEEGMPLSEYPDFPAGGMRVMPGTEADKLVAVEKLEESADCWVRIQLNQSIKMQGEDEKRGMDGDPITLRLDENNWLRGEDENGVWDGWYYYKNPLTQDAPLTTLLLSQVEFGPAMGNEYQGAEYVIDVVAQAVQLANNPAPAGGDATDVLGWPAVQ